jgi:hypothetical protein
VDVRRSAEISTLDPLTPPMAGVAARLAASAPYLAGAVPGVEDPDPTVASDPLRPLVVYLLDDATLVLRVAKAPAGRLRLDW